MSSGKPRKGTTRDEKKADRMLVHVKKMPNHRTLHVDGAYGGLTPKGYIFMELFTEHNAIPQTIKRAFKKLDEHTVRIMPEKDKASGKEGIVWECETALIMDLRTAVSIRDWMNSKIEEAEEIGILQRSGEETDGEEG